MPEAFSIPYRDSSAPLPDQIEQVWLQRLTGRPPYVSLACLVVATDGRDPLSWGSRSSRISSIT